MIKLYNGDCLEVMQELIEQNIKVNAIITDPPYGTTACKWDSVITFEPMWNCLHKLVKDNGVIVLFGSEPFSSALRMSNIQDFREDLIWVKNKSSSGFKSEQVHLKVHENIIVFSGQCKYTFNPVKWFVEEDFIIKRKTFNFLETNNIIGHSGYRQKSCDDGSRNPISVIPFKIPYSPKKNSKCRNGDYRVHPTQKPVALMEYLVKTYTNEGETVLDFTMGSGTTGVACKKLNRNFIGIELEEKYFNIAKERIDKISECEGNDE